MTGKENADEALRIRAMAHLLVERGILDQLDIDRQVEEQLSWTYAQGARLVARAWCDPAFRERLLNDAKSAAAELDIDASAITQFEVLENTADRHHVVVCTLCSCYPRPVLGQPPDWYKSTEYRARMVREPRAVLEEFGLTLPDDIDVVVMDSTADRRFMVLPRRPARTEHLDESTLAELVTRDSLIGVAEVQAPQPATDHG